MKFLTAYQNAAYAARYRAAVDKVKAAEAARAPGKCGLADAVARYLFKLMAYKDEYEVARLYSDGSFLKQVANEFEGDNLRFEFHLAPPLLARRDRTTGLPRKMSFGPWLLPAFRLLAKFKFLRGTALDPFVEDGADGSLGRQFAHDGAADDGEDRREGKTVVGEEPVTGGPVTELRAAGGEQTGHGMTSQTKQGAQRESLGVRGEAPLVEAGEALAPELFAVGGGCRQSFF